MVFDPIPDPGLLNPLDFLGDRRSFCSHEVTWGELLGGAGDQKDQAIIRSFALSGEFWEICNSGISKIFMTVPLNQPGMDNGLTHTAQGMTCGQ